MYVVVVEFRVAPGKAAEFMGHMRTQARNSLASEPGCRQFDVCVAEGDPQEILLYEVYDDRAAFEAHLAAPYFAPFDAAVQPLITSKTVRIMTLDKAG